MERQRGDQPDADDPLCNQAQRLLARPLASALQIEFMQFLTYRLRELCSVTKEAKLLHQQTGRQTADQHRHAHRRHSQEEITEVPTRRFGNDQVLRLTHHRHHAPQSGTHPGMHHQAAQEGAKLFQYLAVMRIDMAVILQILTRTRGGHAVINTVKPHRDAYHHRDDRQRVQEG